jgi:hypothetical protein
LLTLGQCSFIKILRFKNLGTASLIPRLLAP